MKRLASILLASFALGTFGLAAGEAKCPVSGKDVDPECTLNVNGKPVAFCCEKCRGKFEQILHVKDEGPGACPLSGKPADKATRMLVSTVKAVHFCCNKCARKYAAKHPGTAIKDDGPGKCVISGEPAEADVFVIDRGRKVYFCCNKCRKKYIQAHNVVMVDEGPGKCPVSGEDAEDGPVLYEVQTQAVYFCCEKCAAKYVKEKITAKL
ncbi:MAG: hypothetical protein D6766_11400 [Verrucomicrobia bacterium]|nr:MAG: hypothetical protein D6766_11400 [Verrucomicrobiota bacterium]